MYYYNNNLGCLIGTIIFLMLFFSFTRVLFTTPIGWLIIAYVVIRWISRRSTQMNRQEPLHRESPKEEPKSPEREAGFDKSDVIDIDFVEIDEEDEDQD
ncbi:MAG: hypothetical protein AVO33_00825 [delta proteobacterium ML8_F1]|nr:MAG: hypothetical protein AVO33_00825 [delta proteobacterium ML8_F1]